MVWRISLALVFEFILQKAAVLTKNDQTAVTVGKAWGRGEMLQLR